MHQIAASPIAAMAIPYDSAALSIQPLSGVEAEMLAFMLTGSGLAGVVIVIILYARHRDQIVRDAERAGYRLTFPPDVDIKQVVSFMRSLTALEAPRWSLFGRASVVFEVVSRQATIEYRLWLPSEFVGLVLAQLRGNVPGVVPAPLGDATLPRLFVARELAMTNQEAPLKTGDASGFATSVLAAMSVAAEEETVVLQITAIPVGIPVGLPTSKPTQGHSQSSGVLPGALTGSQASTPDRKEQTSKVSEPHFGVACRVGAGSPQAGRSRRLVRQVVGTMRQLGQPRVRLVTRPWPPVHVLQRLRRGATPTIAPALRLNAQELATLVVWPLGGPVVPGLALVSGRLFPPTAEVARAGLVLGRAVYPGLERPVALRPADALMHLLVTGPTGSGKSTLLLNLITQQLANGNGLVLIDPNGDLARDVTDRIPEQRLSDLIYLHPGDQRVVGLNPLDCALDDAELVADQLLDLIRSHADNWGPVIDETLKATLVLLAATPGMTLVEMPAVLLDAGFRRRVLGTLNPAFAPTVGEFFARYEAMSTGQQATAASAALNKVTPFLDRRSIRAMLGTANPPWNMRTVLDGRQILVVSLPGGLIGPVAADLVGSVIVTQVWNAALSRQDTTRDQRRPVSLVIDELPRFVRGGGMDLTDVLARARGYGLGLVGALQHIGQVRPDLRAALMSEARSKIIFQAAADDAVVLARHLPGVEPADLLGLSARHALAAVVAGSRVAAPVTIATAPPPEVTGFGSSARAVSRQTFGRDRDQVERDIAARRQGPDGGPRRTRRIEE